MIVEIFRDELDTPYVFLEDGSKWYMGIPATTKLKEYVDNRLQGSYQVVEVPNSLKPEEIVELSKSGIRADEIIRLRQAGVL